MELILDNGDRYRLKPVIHSKFYHIKKKDKNFEEYPSDKEDDATITRLCNSLRIEHKWYAYEKIEPTKTY